MTEEKQKRKRKPPCFLNNIDIPGFSLDISEDVFVKEKTFQKTFLSLPDSEKPKYAFEYMVQSLVNVGSSLYNIDAFSYGDKDVELFVKTTINKVNFVLENTLSEELKKFLDNSTSYHVDFKKLIKSEKNLERFGNRMRYIFCTRLEFNQNIPQVVIEVLEKGFRVYEKIYLHELYIEENMEIWGELDR